MNETKRRATRGSTTGRPIMRVLDVLGRRWSLRVLWELRKGPLTFRALQEAAGGLSPSVLNARLTELRELGVVEMGEPSGYVLTDRGRALAAILLELDAWAKRAG